MVMSTKDRNLARSFLSLIKQRESLNVMKPTSALTIVKKMMNNISKDACKYVSLIKPVCNQYENFITCIFISLTLSDVL